jgi:hypothetical protein
MRSGGAGGRMRVARERMRRIGVLMNLASDDGGRAGPQRGVPTGRCPPIRGRDDFLVICDQINLGVQLIKIQRLGIFGQVALPESFGSSAVTASALECAIEDRPLYNPTVDRNHRDARRGAPCRLMADRLNLFARASIATMLGRPSTEKEASVTVASPRSAASLAVGILMSSAVSDKRSEVAALRATISSAARTRKVAVSFTLTAYSGMGQALAWMFPGGPRSRMSSTRHPFVA